jgi:hypothetical protein
MSRRLPWKTDTLKLLSMEEGCIPTTRVPGGYSIAIGTSQQKIATAVSIGVLRYNWWFKKWSGFVCTWKRSSIRLT